MKKLYIKLAGAMLTLMGVLAPTTVSAQCANNNALWVTVGNINPGQTVTINGTYGGEYNTFNVVSGSTYVISTCNGGSWDSQLTLYNNTGGSALAFNDDFCGLRSQITWTATFNGTVRALLDQYNCSSNSSSMTMTITRSGGGGGGNCWDGTIAGTGNATGTTCNAGNESNLRSSTDRIYRVQIQSAGCYNFSLCGTSSSWDSYMYLTTACPGTGGTAGGGTIIAQNDDACGLLSQISNVTLAAGTYYVTIEGWGSSDCGNFSLNVSNASTTAPSAGAISAPSAFGCGTVANFAVPFQTGISYNWSTTNGTIISGQGTSSVNIAWGSGSGTVSVVPTNSCGTQGSASSIIAACTPPPANDLCANAPVFTGNSQSFSNVFATGTDISTCGFNDFNDVWYSWTAPSCGQVTFSTVCGANFDTHLSLYTGCGGTELACNDDAYDYSCGTGLTSRITANVTAGQTYLLRVAGYNGAQGTGTVSMSMSSPLSVTATAGSIACFGGSTTVNVAATGGSGVYSGTGSYTVGAGTYNYTVTDSYGCSASTSLNITQPTAIDASASATPILCNGGTSVITVSGQGGTLPYTGVGVYNVGAGAYAYTVTDGNGCQAMTFISISEPELLEASSNATSILCNGGSSDVTVSAAGGTSPYTGVGVYNVGAGSYAYTVTDGNGCQAITFINITEPAILEASSSATAILCNGGSSDITVSATGGTSPYTGDGVYTVGAGSYSYTVTDGNGCVASTAIDITEPALLVASSSATAILCNGGSSDVTVSATGGTLPYSGDGAYTVGAGSYTYAVTDVNGCVASTTIDITEPALLTVDAGSDETVFVGYGPMECANLDATVNGGTPSYSVIWTSYASGGGIGSSLTACPTANEVYTVTVTDANGCTAYDDLSICVVDVTCYAGNSSIQKVEMCQIPPGNPGNAHTICVDASAVPAHLAIGCQLGECGELAGACTAVGAKSISTESVLVALTAYPNPTENTTTISVTLTKGGIYSVEMFDMMGKKVQTVYAGSFEDYENLEFDVDMTNLNTGIYMISVLNGDQKIENIRVMKN